jgi:hypothetical protein
MATLESPTVVHPLGDSTDALVGQILSDHLQTLVQMRTDAINARTAKYLKAFQSGDIDGLIQQQKEKQ